MQIRADQLTPEFRERLEKIGEQIRVAYEARNAVLDAIKEFEDNTPFCEVMIFDNYSKDGFLSQVYGNFDVYDLGIHSAWDEKKDTSKAPEIDEFWIASDMSC